MEKFNAFRKRIYSKRWVRIVHLILQYIIIIFVFPVAFIAILYTLDYLWKERPGLLFVALSGTYLTVCSICYFLRNRKIRKSLEENGKLPKEAKKRIIHDLIVITEIFIAYITVKCLLKFLSS